MPPPLYALAYGVARFRERQACNRVAAKSAAMASRGPQPRAQLEGEREIPRAYKRVLRARRAIRMRARMHGVAFGVRVVSSLRGVAGARRTRGFRMPSACLPRGYVAR